MKRVLTLYKSLSLPLKSAFWFTVGNIVQAGISVLSTPIFTRFLPMDEYGKLYVFTSWTDVMVILITLSTWRGLLNLYSKGKDKDESISAVISLSIILSSVWIVIALVFYKFVIKYLGLSSIMLIYIIAYSVSQNIILAWMIRRQYDYDYRIVVGVNIVYSFISAFGGLAAVFLFGRTAEIKLLPQIASIVIIAIIIVVRSLLKCCTIYNKSVWTYCLTFAIPLIPHYFSEIVLQSSDRIMIDRLCTKEDVSVYGIAYTTGSLILLISGAINSAFVPYQYQKIKEKNYKELAQKTNFIIGFIAVALCLLMLFSREIVLLFGGGRYEKSISLVVPICLGVYFNYVFQLFARIQEYFEQKYTIVIASVSCATLNIVLNYIFINIFGFSAASYTTFVCYFVFCILHYFFYRYACKKNINQQIYDIKGISIISLCLIGFSLTIKLFNSLYYLKYILLLLLIVLVVIFRKRIISGIKEMLGGKNR